jgi:hypothetical protein
MIFSRGLTIWKSNIAMEHGQFTDDLPIKMVIVHSYVSLPKGMNGDILRVGFQGIYFKSIQWNIYIWIYVTKNLMFGFVRTPKMGDTSK